MNFALRCVGFGETELNFHSIDGHGSSSKLIGYLWYRLSQAPERQRSFPVDRHDAFASDFWSTHPAIVLNGGREIYPIRSVSQQQLQEEDLRENPSEEQLVTCEEAFGVLNDGTARGQRGWLYFQGTRQTAHVVDKLSVGGAQDRKPQSQQHHTISITATDLILATVGDLKLELANRLQIGVGEMMLIAPDWDGSDADLSNDTPLFPYLCDKGVGTFKLARREGMHVSVKVGLKTIALSRFPIRSTVADVRRRLSHSFHLNVFGFEVEVGPEAGALIEDDRPLIDLTVEGVNVYLVAVEEDPAIKFRQLLNSRRSNSPSRLLKDPSRRVSLPPPTPPPPPVHAPPLSTARSSVPPADATPGVTAKIQLENGRAKDPIEIALPDDGHFTARDLLRFLRGEELILDVDSAIVFHGRSRVHPSSRLFDLLPRPPETAGHRRHAAVIHLTIR
jgi:hypothetical protein